MDFPDNEATRTTERIMAKVKDKLPDIDVHNYNRTFEAVHEVLNEKNVNDGVSKLERLFGKR
jgi:ABC-type sulfate transport system substrate-binding protein